MTVQAQAMTLSIRQFRVFDLDRVSARVSLGVPRARERRDLGFLVPMGVRRATA